MVYQQTKLRNWIDIETIDWNYISSNKNDIELLKANQLDVFITK
jgi:hypothetical protein